MPNIAFDEAIQDATDPTEDLVGASLNILEGSDLVENNVPEILDFLTENSGYVGQTHLFQLSAEDPDFNQLIVDFVVNSNPINQYTCDTHPDNCSLEIEHVFSNFGDHEVEVIVSDSIRSVSSTTTVNIENRSPEISWSGDQPAEASVGEEVDFVVVATDPDGNLDTVTLYEEEESVVCDSLGENMYKCNYIFTSNGPHTVIVIAEDGEGSTDTTEEHIIEINTAPVISWSGDQPVTANINEAVSFVVEVIDDNISTVTLHDENEDELAVCSNTTGNLYECVYVFTSNGTHEIQVIAIDEDDSSSETELHSININTAPVVDWSGDQPAIANINEAVSFYVDATDPDDIGIGAISTVKLYESEIELAVCNTTENLYGCTYAFADSGTHMVKVVAVDEGGLSAETDEHEIVVTDNISDDPDLSGIVFFDGDGSGSMDVETGSVETGINGATVELWSGDVNNGTFEDTVVTDGTGAYSFDGLVDGVAYFMKVTDLGDTYYTKRMTIFSYNSSLDEKVAFDYVENNIMLSMNIPMYSKDNNNSGVVNGEDLGAVLNGMDQISNYGHTYKKGDLNYSFMVNGEDLGFVLNAM